MKFHPSGNRITPNRVLFRVASTLCIASICVALSACRGAPCSNCGGYAQPGYGAGYQNPYQQQTAPVTQYPGVVAPQGVYPQGNTQPGFYNPGSVPIAPQQGQPGSAFGG
jgi:hypothetical protein